MSAADCVFCKIATGTIPSAKVLETADCLAFLDINPLAAGHTLLIPRQHAANLLDVRTEVLAGLCAQLPRLACAIQAVTGATGLNILQNSGESSGQVVMHLHFHLIPRRAGDNLGYRWNTTAYRPGEAEALQDRLLDAIRV